MRRLLHIGCGHKTKAETTAGFAGPEWEEVRLDIDPSVSPDIVGTMTDMSAVAEGSMDAVFSSHNIEHLYSFEVPQTLSEFSRVLRPDGIAVVTCPDVQAVAAAVAEGRLLEPLYKSTMGLMSAIDILYGHRPSLAQGNLHMAHRTAFTGEVLAGFLHEAGFAKIIMRRRPRVFDIWAVATKSTSTSAELQALAEAHIPPQPAPRRTA